jgi:hypothetical protein
MIMNSITIKVQTVLNENEEFDQLFYAYLDEYSIDHKILESEEKFPDVEYTGGIISLNNMLRERFGYTKEEIEETYPELVI